MAQATAPLLALNATARERASICLTAAVYYEAGGEPRSGQEAVAQVVLNRLRHPRYPKSICGVVYQGAPHPGCQFTFACDGSLARAPDPRGWRRAAEVASQALEGFVQTAVGPATHYHTGQVHPAWDAEMREVTRIGAHLFYRLQGALGESAALTGAYAGVEPDPSRPPPLAPRRLVARPPATPQAVAFSVWGLQVATVRPDPTNQVAIVAGPPPRLASFGTGPAPST